MMALWLGAAAAMLPALALQQPADSAPWTLIGAGSGAGMTGLMFYFYRLRETQYTAERAAIALVAAQVAEKSEARYVALATDMRDAYQEATAAITKLTVLMEHDHRAAPDRSNTKGSV